jgi:hypothetical protein
MAYDLETLKRLYGDADAAYLSSLGGGAAELYTPNTTQLINGQYIQPFEGGYSVRNQGTGSGDTFKAYLPNGTIEDRYINEWEPGFLDKLIAAGTKAFIGAGFAGAAGFGPLATGAGAASAGTSAGYLGAADAAGGLLPEFGTIGAYEAGLTGAGATGLSSGASSLAGSTASGAGEVAGPGWISAEGGAGYAGGMAADAATGNAFTNALAGASKFLSNPLVQVGTSLVSGAIASNAAKKAADAQLTASREAIDEQRRQYDQTRTDLAPWRDRGAGAANRMAVMMGLSGNASDPNFNKGYLTSPSYAPQNNNRLSQMMNVLNQRVGVR